MRYGCYGHPLPPCRSTWRLWAPSASTSFDVTAMGTLCLLVVRLGSCALPLPPRRSTWRLCAPSASSSFDLAAVRSLCLLVRLGLPLVVRLGGYGHPLPPRRSTWRQWAPCLCVVRLGDVSLASASFDWETFSLASASFDTEVLGSHTSALFDTEAGFRLPPHRSTQRHCGVLAAADLLESLAFWAAM
jgi:hypothetical protein